MGNVEHHSLSIKLMFFNPRSLNNKVGKIFPSLQDKDVDIVGFSETWLTGTNTPTTAQIKNSGYDLVSEHRDNRRGGGTAIVFKLGYMVKELNLNFTINSFELKVARIKNQNSKDVVFGVIYRTGPLTNIFASEIDELLGYLCSNFDNVIIGGDFNIHFEDSGNKIVKQYMDIFKSYGFKQQIFEPTHKGGGTIDQVFIFSIDNILSCSHEVDNRDNWDSDHFPIYLTTSLSLEKKIYKTLTYRKFSSSDHYQLNEKIKSIVLDFETSENFKSTYMALNIDLNEALDYHAPYVTKTVSIIKEAPWFDKEYRQLRSQRRYAEKKWRKDKSDISRYNEYKKLSVQASCLADAKKKKFFNDMLAKTNNNPRTLFNLVNSVMDRKQDKPLPSCFENIGQMAANFNKFFKDKIVKIRDNMDTESPPELSMFLGSTLLDEFEPTDYNEISSIIKESGLKTKVDDILPSRTMKDNIESLIPCFVELVNLSLRTGNMDGLKTADIIPSLKDDSLDNDALKNFRPISNLEFVGKLIERVVLRRLNKHMSINNLDIPEQSAYKRQHSTETLLVRLTNDILIASDSKSATVVLLLDLSAAFDTVDHNLLLSILQKEIGIVGTALKWFGSFLTCRTHKTRCGHVCSDEIIIMFGVPQGSVLGPVLFNIYIRSIYNTVKLLGFSIFGYADDHQILKTFRSNNQHLVLAEDLSLCFSSIHKWMCQYYLQLNAGKTKIIVFGPPDVLSNITIMGTFLQHNTVIRFVSTVKNLGFLMDSSMTMEKQVMNVKIRCFKTIRNISKIRSLLSHENLKTIVNSLVVSCIDYCNVLYYGINQDLLTQLQRIQNAASKIVMGKFKYDHVNNDLRILHWLPIRKRIIFKIALLVYKSLNGLVPRYIQDMFYYVSHGESFRLNIPNIKTKIGSRALSVIGPKVFNSLPRYIRNADTIEIFKRDLKTYLFNLPDHQLIFD